MQWLQGHLAIVMLIVFLWLIGRALGKQEKDIHALRMRIAELEEITKHLDRT